MFGTKKDKPKKEQAEYEAQIGSGINNTYYDVYEYRLIDNGVLELRTTRGKVTLMPGTPCQISGGEWE